MMPRPTTYTYCCTMAGLFEHFHMAPVAAVSSSLLPAAANSLVNELRPSKRWTNSRVLLSSAHCIGLLSKDQLARSIYYQQYLENGSCTVHLELSALHV